MTIIRLFAVLIPISLFPQLEVTAQTSQLEVTILNNEDPVIIHTLDEGQTIYGISKTYNLEINTLMDANPMLETDNLKIGQDIIVPIQRSEICYLGNKCPEMKNVQLIYNVKHKDNLFRISRIYFDTDIDIIKRKNNIKGNTLSPGTKLNIGRIAYSDYLDSYLKPEHVEIVAQVTPSEAEIIDTNKIVHEPIVDVSKEKEHDTEQQEVTSIESEVKLDPLGPNNAKKVEKQLEDQWASAPSRNETIEDKNMISEGATGYWNKNQSSKKGFFILHKSLPNNTQVQITNPVTNKTVSAKVVGNIPDNIYAPEIEMVVTSEVASAIGILDKKFFARISYPKDLSMSSLNE
ncbi:LysM peptidoglycan-binding domain-containing protein [Membranihabitans maritimus]|uniref:LysM peptidoglycan-binding domain-containing protein n=1 Tax=Membranihabitans maritimus TaxID=2904244 RepID=UPI001F18EB54|nr:LysM peptidoglycan-binding domain-containing protein [Membranihabitans maritimus]